MTGTKKTNDPVDVHIGGRIRLRRMLLGLSQETLGEAIGLTFQQVQKYERGFNRVAGARLVKIAEALNVPVSFFFDGMAVGGATPAVTAADGDRLYDRETLELVRAYYQIPDEAARKRLYDLVKAMGRTGVDAVAA